MMQRVAPPPIVCLAGPTAAGKSAAMLALASRWPIEIINVDSATIYRGMDIGTAKPTLAEQAITPQHLLDIRDPAQSYSAAEFVADTHTLIAQIRQRDRIPVLAGGTMLYFKALRDGLDDLPQADPALREMLTARAARQGWPALHAELALLDPVTAARLAPGDSQRIQRALEICMLSGRPMSALLSRNRKEKSDDATQDSDSPGGPAAGLSSSGGHPARRAAPGSSQARDDGAASVAQEGFHPIAHVQRPGSPARPGSRDARADAAAESGASANESGQDGAGQIERTGCASHAPTTQESWLTISLEPADRLALHARIAHRFDAMMDRGLLGEVAGLRTRTDLHPGLPAIRCVGYRQMWAHLAGEIDLDTAREQAVAATRQLAKRQLTWLRSQPERQIIDCLKDDAAERVVEVCARVFG